MSGSSSLNLIYIVHVCGFSVILSDKHSDYYPETILQNSLAKLKGRGPDQQEISRHPGISIVSSRLIIEGDEISGKQPLLSSTGNSVIVFNGQIYNYKQLGIDYLGRAYDSDSHFLVDFIERFQASKLEELNGMFAFVYISINSHNWIAARDRLGVKPLFFSHKNDQYVFSSSLSALIAIDTNVSMDLESLEVIRTFRTPPVGKTIYKEISELPAGTYMERKSAGRVTTWWDIRSNYNSRNFEITEFKEILDSAIKLRTHSSRETALYASGGIDSFLIASSKIHSLNVLHSGSSQNIDFDVSNSIYLEEIHRVKTAIIQSSSSDLEEKMKEIIKSQLNLVLVENMLAMSRMSNFVRSEGYKLVLTGDGADELFYGYEKLSWAYISEGINISEFIQKYDYSKSFSSKAEGEVWGMLMHYFDFDRDEVENREYFLKYFWLKVHLRPLLDRLDRATAEMGIEARSPFLDPEMLRFGLSRSSKGIIDSNYGKIPLRSLARKLGHEKALVNEKYSFKVSGSILFQDYSFIIGKQLEYLFEVLEGN